MISVGKYPSVKIQNSTHSMFLKFNYNQETVARVKSLPVRFYEPENKVWEVPIQDIDRVVKLFGKDNVVAFNEFPEFIEYIEGLTTVNKKSIDELIQYYETIKPEAEFKFKTKPDGHQIEAFNFGLTRDVMFITDEMGLGKTMMALNLMDYRKEIGKVKHVLVICGVNGLKYNWVEEIKKHSYNNCQVIDGTKAKRIEKIQSYWQFFYNIINIESLRDEAILEFLSKLCSSGKISGIIIDEFHKANNHKSQQGKGLRELDAKYKIALSGTPITKRIDKSWSMLNWMGIENSTYWNFVKRYCYLGGYTGWEPTGEYKNLDELHERFDRYQIRRTKDILKLPPKIYQTIYVEMTKDERNEYTQIKRGILRDIESGDVRFINPAVATIKLRLFTDKIKTRALKNTITSLIEDNEQPCVVFSMYKEGLYILQEELKDFKPLLLTGDILKAEDKQKVIKAFQDEKESNVLMGTIQAMGTGYTLTRASYVNFLNKSWTVTDNIQAEDRCHRRGTTGSVTVVTYIVKNSVDERVEEILANDKIYIDKVVDGVPIFKMNNKQIFDEIMRD